MEEEVKVSELSQASNANDNDLLMLVQEGTNKKVTVDTLLSDIKTEINSTIQSGSNTNGSWVKLFDGTMICYIKSKALTQNQSMTEITLPNSYLASDYVVIASSAYGSNADIVMAAFAYTADTIRVYPRTNSGGTISQEELCNIITIGKWK